MLWGLWTCMLSIVSFSLRVNSSSWIFNLNDFSPVENMSSTKANDAAKADLSVCQCKPKEAKPFHEYWFINQIFYRCIWGAFKVRRSVRVINHFLFPPAGGAADDRIVCPCQEWRSSDIAGHRIAHNDGTGSSSKKMRVWSLGVTPLLTPN